MNLHVWETMCYRVSCYNAYDYLVLFMPLLVYQLMVVV